MRIAHTEKVETNGHGGNRVSEGLFFLTGLGAGIALTILLAPRSGAAMRRLIGHKVEKGENWMKDKAASAQDYVQAVGKKFNLQKGRDFRASVHRIQRHGMCVVGSFIVGIDTDRRGIGEAIARAAKEYGVDAANVLILTPLPGTKLYAEMEREGRIRSNDYPQDWRYYTLTCPVADYKHLTWEEVVEEVKLFNDQFYSYSQILRRMLRLARNTRSLRTFLVTLVANLSYRSNHLLDRRIYASRVQSVNLGNAAAVELVSAALPLQEPPLALAGHRGRTT